MTNMEQAIMNKVFDTNYSSLLPEGGYPQLPVQTETISQHRKMAEKITEDVQNKEATSKVEQTEKTQTPTTTQSVTKKKKQNFFDRMLSKIFPSTIPGTQKVAKLDTSKQIADNPVLSNKDLRAQVQAILKLPDDEYSDKKLTSKLRQYISEVNKHYSSVISDYKSHVAPSYREFKGTHYNVSGILGKTYYVQSYPSYIDSLRTRDILSFHSKRDMSFFIYPEDDASIQSMLKQRATQLKAQINEALQKGITLDTEIEQQYKDVEMIRQKITTREERYFETSYYINLYNEDKNKLKEEGRKLEQKLGGYGVKTKNAVQRMDEGFASGLPLAKDDLGITRSAISSSLAGSFPFISNDLIDKTGILYGVNTHTGSLVIFDRFNFQLPNMNATILATSGAGKSFTVKLEIMRYLINGIDCIVIDPENEYKSLCKKVGGSYINVSTSSQQYINPFDIPEKIEDVEYGKGDLLRSQIMNLMGLIKLLIGKMDAKQEAVLDKALQNTYLLKGFSMEENSYEDKQPPLMEDLLNVLDGMTGGEDLSLKLSKYVSGTFGKVFNNYTNVDIDNELTVFSIRDLEDALKTPGMFNILNFIRTKIRTHKKQRLLSVDEARIMLQHDVSAEFLFGLTKRARKYGLGITTISQDIEDFVNSKYGKPIISNSALQILLKQSPTSIKALNDLLGLSESEQRHLVSAGIGEGLMFAGSQHVGVKILASPGEKEFITTDIT